MGGTFGQRDRVCSGKNNLFQTQSLKKTKIIFFICSAYDIACDHSYSPKAAALSDFLTRSTEYTVPPKYWRIKRCTMRKMPNARDPIAYGCMSAGRRTRKRAFRARGSGEDQSTFARRGAACRLPFRFPTRSFSRRG